MTLIILSAVFVAVAGLIVGGYLFANRTVLDQGDAARSRLQMTVEEQRRTASILKGTNVSDLPFLNRLLSGRSLTREIEVGLQQAGLLTSPGTFVMYIMMAAAAGALVGSMLGGVYVMVLTIPIGATLPLLWLRMKKRKRLSTFQAQLPDAIDMLVNAMRAGYSFQAAMRFIGEEVTAPLGPEFSRFYEEQRLGMDVRTALLSLQDRVASLDLKMFVTAVLIQRETGGNLSEVLANISGLMRERAAVKGEIETLTAESKLSARILSVLPLLVFIAIKISNPAFLDPMLARQLGRIALGIAVMMVIAGYFTMMKIADIDI